MSVKLRQRIGKIISLFAHALFVRRFPIVGDRPKLDCRIFRRGCKHRIIEGTPFRIQNSTTMSLQNGRRTILKTSWTVMSAYDQWTTSAKHRHRPVFRRCLDVLLFPRCRRNTKTSEAHSLFGLVTIDVTVFRLSDLKHREISALRFSL